MPRSKPSTRFEDIVAIVPASGKGERFGQAKAGASLHGRPFVEHISATLAEAGIREVFVALSYDTPDMLATLRRAVSEVQASAPLGFLIWPVDHPFVSVETATRLCDAFLANPDAVVRPVCHGSAGHPILIPAWLDLDADDRGLGLAGIVRSRACTVVDLPVEDDAVLRNINLPSDLEE